MPHRPSLSSERPAMLSSYHACPCVPACFALSTSAPSVASLVAPTSPAPVLSLLCASSAVVNIFCRRPVVPTFCSLASIRNLPHGFALVLLYHPCFGVFFFNPQLATYSPASFFRHNGCFYWLSALSSLLRCTVLPRFRLPSISAPVRRLHRHVISPSVP